MIALLGKDWRLNRAPVIASLLVLVLPYLLSVILSVYSAHRIMVDPIDFIVENLCGTSIGVFGLLALLSPVYGAIAFAQERREKSADFLAMLPATRFKIIVSKLIIAVLCIGLPFMIDLVVFELFLRFSEATYRGDIGQLEIFGGISVMMFGIAWLCSTFLSSPAISFSIALGITLSAVFLIDDLWSYQELRIVSETILIAGAYLAGTLCLIGGSIYWMQRVEP